MKKENEKYVDKYFLRTKEILQKEGLNPFVRAQVFVRKGPGIISGLDEAVEFIAQNSDLIKNGGALYALNDGDEYLSKETQMLIEARIDDIVALETQYLGILSAGITKANDGTEPNFVEIRNRVKQIVLEANGRPVSYFGARHWHYNKDSMIAQAAFEGGAISASTDAGAQVIGQKGIGTIPHALENIYAFQNGKDSAVLEATRAFDRVIDPSVPRVALIDYNNREIDDTLSVLNTIKSMYGVRVDTCGENIAQGALSKYDAQEFERFFGKSVNIPEEDLKFWTGSGVTVSGIYAMRNAMDAAGFQDKKIMLTSGFGDPSKVRAFTRAEDLLETKLYDGLGVGGVYDSRAATMDIVAVGETRESMIPMSKVGRNYSPNLGLALKLGEGPFRKAA